jgi:type III pantothenate kinase
VQFCCMNLIIDQGNTATKAALFEGGILKTKVIYAKKDIHRLEDWIAQNCQSDTNVLWSSVTNQPIKINSKKILCLTSTTPLPIENEYETPETLGKDRIANAVAIWSKTKNNSALCIDMGTCIKYDLVVENAYKGGNISPGMVMRYKALNVFTDQLPEIMPNQAIFENNFPEYGISTATSIINGVQQAIVHEVNGFVARYQERFGPLTIFMSGGDAKFFDKAFKKGIFAFSVKYWEDLTLCGLNEILEYNVKS